MIVVRRPERPPLNINLPVDRGNSAEAMLAADDASGCAPLPGRRRGRSHRPLEVALRWDRVRMCTTALRRERANQFETNAQTRIARGSARSSRQTVPALGPPRFQDGAATLGAHTGAKAVLLGALQIVGLKGALQRKPPRKATPVALRKIVNPDACYKQVTPELQQATALSRNLATNSTSPASQGVDRGNA